MCRSKQGFQRSSLGGPEDDIDDEQGIGGDDGRSGQEEPPEVAIVDIQLNDDDLETPSATLDKAIQDVLIAEDKLDWSNYSRKPFPHQVLGTRWILGLALGSDGFGGGLLADDMGLGKTFMSLASMDHLHKASRSSQSTEKPCLVVAPLSLLQNWADEVDQTFSRSPFSDVVILQSDGKLNDFRVGGIETKNQMLEDEETAEIRYSLKIGSSFANERLDIPRRLVYKQLIRHCETISSHSVRWDWGHGCFRRGPEHQEPQRSTDKSGQGD